jgi:hypothetical protein
MCEKEKKMRYISYYGSLPKKKPEKENTASLSKELPDICGARVFFSQLRPLHQRHCIKTESDDNMVLRSEN